MFYYKLYFYITLSVFLIFSLNLSTEARRKARRSKGWNEGHPVPHVDVINSTTVLLLNIPTRGTKPNCPLVKYTVKVREERTNYVMTRNINGVTDQLTIRFLDPNSNYSIRIIPRDCAGRSWISSWISFTTAYPPIPEPARLIQTQAFTNSIFVSWSPPSSGVGVKGYVVGYGEGVPEVNWQYMEGNRTNMTIKNLKKNTQYVVSVRAYNSAGKGPAVYEVVETKDDVLDKAPPSPILEAKVKSATSIALRWTDPSLPAASKLSKLPEDNRYYSVKYSYRHPQDGRFTEKTEVSKKLEMVLSRLNANTEFHIKVRIVKDGQAGPYSLPVIRRTLEAAPPQSPRSVTISVFKVGDSNRSVDVLVTWKPPKLTNGNITSYLVQYTDNLELSVDLWKAITVAGKTETVISNLVYGKAYYFRVQAKNSQGFGPKTFILKMYALPHNEHTPALLKMVHTVGNKTKRDQSLDSPENGNFNDQTPPHVDFKVILQVKINGFITWPEQHPSSECGREKTASGYKFAYHKAGESTWNEVQLNVNMYVMENMELNTAYEYKVAYMTEDSMMWTKLHHLSTSPDQHDPID